MTFRYVKKDTIADRMCPLVKLILILFSLILALSCTFTQDIIALLIWLITCLGWWAIGKIEPLRLGMILKILAGTFIFIIIVQGFMYRYGETPIFIIGHFRIWGGADIGVFTLEGLLFGLLIVLRILTVVTPSVFLIMTTSVHRIAASLAKLKVPFKFNFIFLTALRFTPLVYKTFEDIKDAQKLRAFDIDSMNIFTRARRAYVPIVTPLMLYLFRKSMDLQVAIESRAFGAPGRRTFIEEVDMKKGDYMALLQISVTFIICIIIKLFYAASWWPIPFSHTLQ